MFLHEPHGGRRCCDVSVDASGNLVVIADDTTLDQIRQQVAGLDAPARQRLIESEAKEKISADATQQTLAKVNLDRRLNSSEKNLVEVTDSGVKPVQRETLAQTDPMSTMPTLRSFKGNSSGPYESTSTFGDC